MNGDITNERKIVSVLFCDIAGSYTFLYDNDPEQGKLIIDSAIEEMTQVIERFGGVVNQVQGDGVMSLFGAPVAMEDHAEQACLAALELVDAFKQKNTENAWPDENDIEIRIGISTGEAVVGVQSVKLPFGGESYDYFATGAVSHLAGRLQKLAGLFEVVISNETASAIGGDAETATIVDRAVHELIQSHDKPRKLISLRPAHNVQPKISSLFVGREAELGYLSDAFSSVLTERVARAIVVTGEPGFGKSRLISEFLNKASDTTHRVLTVSASRVEQNSPFALVRQLLLVWLHQYQSSSEESLESTLLQCCEKVDPNGWVFVESVRDMLGQKVRNPEWAKLEPDIRREEIFRSLHKLFEYWGREKPTVICFEDMHWSDPVSQQSLEALFVRGVSQPVFVIYTSREQLQTQESDYLRSLQLQPLSPDESRQMLGRIGLEGGLSAAESERLIERSGGVPFFIEQMAFLSGREDDSEEPGARIKNSPVSPAIRSLISARIDQLETDLKRTVIACCVAGIRFDLESICSVTSVSKPELQQSLQQLVGAGIVKAGPDLKRYEFAHALYQEVAYLSMLRKQQLTQHVAFLEYFKQLADASPDSDYAEQILFHAWHGQQWSDVAHYGSRAANAATETGAYKESIFCLECALHAYENLPPVDEKAVANARIQKRAELHLALSRACIPIGEFRRAYHSLDVCQTLSVSAQDNHLRCESFAYRTALVCLQEDAKTAISVGEQSVAAARATGSDRLIFGCSVYLGEALFFSGDFQQTIEILQPFVDTGIVYRYPLDRIGNTAPASIDCYGILGMAYAQLGQFDIAEQMGREATKIADQTGKSFDTGLAYFYLTYILVHRCKMDEAEIHLHKVVEIVDSGGVQYLGPWVRGLLGFILARQEQFEKAETLVHKSIADSHSMALRIFEIYGMVSLAYLQTKTGRFDEAATTLREAEEKARLGKYKSVEMWITRSQGVLELDRGEQNKGIEKLLEAIKNAERLGMKPDAAHCHSLIADSANPDPKDESDSDFESSNKSLRVTAGIGTTSNSGISNSSVGLDALFLSSHRRTAIDLYQSMGMPLT